MSVSIFESPLQSVISPATSVRQHQSDNTGERIPIPTDNYWRMKFTRQQIERAIDLKKGGIPWNPGVGQYALDWHGLIKPASPFQSGIYFFLDYPCFVEYFGSDLTEDEIKAISDKVVASAAKRGAELRG